MCSWEALDMAKRLSSFFLHQLTRFSCTLSTLECQRTSSKSQRCTTQIFPRCFLLVSYKRFMLLYASCIDWIGNRTGLDWLEPHKKSEIYWSGSSRWKVVRVLSAGLICFSVRKNLEVPEPIDQILHAPRTCRPILSQPLEVTGPYH